MERPDYQPVTRNGVWLASEEVKAAIMRVGVSEGTVNYKAACWDVLYEINKLIEQAPLPLLHRVE